MYLYLICSWLLSVSLGFACGAFAAYSWAAACSSDTDENAPEGVAAPGFARTLSAMATNLVEQRR